MRNFFHIPLAKIMSGDSLVVTPPWHFTSHSHTYWEFIYFTRGVGRVDIPYVTLHPQPYQLIIYPPGLPHEEYAEDAGGEAWYYLGVNVDAHVPVGSHRILPDWHGEYGWLMAGILREITQDGPNELAHDYLHVLLHLVNRDWETSAVVEHAPVDGVLQYIDLHYEQPITLATLAQIAGISPSRLAHRFTELVGTSPMRYLRQLRIRQAERLLRSTGLPIASVAAKVGFDDPFHFSRIFKRATGASPSFSRLQGLPGCSHDR